jgi:hypothetical protein
MCGGITTAMSVAAQPRRIKLSQYQFVGYMSRIHINLYFFFSFFFLSGSAGIKQKMHQASEDMEVHSNLINATIPLDSRTGPEALQAITWALISQGRILISLKLHN